MPIDYSKFKHRVTLHSYKSPTEWPVIETVWAVVGPPVNSDQSKMDFPFIHTITIPDVFKYHNTKIVMFGARKFLVKKKYCEEDNGRKVINLHCQVENNKDIAMRMALDYLNKDPKSYSFNAVCAALEDALEKIYS